MGGAAGHMSHPFDDKDLTFKDLKICSMKGEFFLSYKTILNRSSQQKH